ncbi:PAS domain-containing protein [Paraburkholderia sp. JHI869]|uniref:PAS domain-containing protein n=1 Tax=Paraburkholderia sp. JHI869 TaxID=3112959 RepID=UPI0031813796
MATTVHEVPDALRELRSCDAVTANALLASDLPCAFVDGRGVVVKANEALEAMTPGLAGSMLADAFGVDPAALADGNADAPGACGIWRSASGEQLPAMVKIVYRVRETDWKVAMVTDCTAFRRAETVRFSKTPYTVMRVSVDGVVRYANEEAHKMFGREPGEMTGHSLDALFPPDLGAPIRATLAECVSNGTHKTHTVRLPRRPGGTPSEAPLVFTPDLTLSGHAFGAVVVIESSLTRQVRGELAKIALDQQNRDWRLRLGSILDKIQPLIPFDHAIFGIYAERRTLFKAVALYPDKETAGEDAVVWPERWLPLKEGLVDDMIRSNDFINASISDALEKNPSLATNEVVKAYRDAEIEASITLFVNGPSGATSALSLCSKACDRYTPSDHEALRNLGLGSILLRCEEQLKREEQWFRRDVKQIVNEERDPLQGAEKVVTQIQSRLNWDLVALYRVDRLNGVFNPIAQAPKEGVELALETQVPIKSGMLGRTLESRDGVLVVNGVKELGIEQHGYERTRSWVKSVMTFSVNLSHRARWIFLIESSKLKAFLGPDRKLLEDLRLDIQRSLQDRLHTETNERLMRETERGTVLVGMDGVILDRNPAAVDMLGLGNTPLGDPRPLWEYGTNDHSRDVLKGGPRESTLNRRIELVARDGAKRLVMATRVTLNDAFDTAIWFFTDLQSLAWSRDLRYLREVVAEVAQQARAPISLASSLFRQLARQSGSDAQSFVDSNTSQFKDLCKRLSAELCKADITYERLVEAETVREKPMRKYVQVDLRACIEGIVATLPARDQLVLQHVTDDGPFIVEGDEERLAFVIRSILGYLLLTRPIDDTMIRLSLRLKTPAEHRQPAVRLKLYFARASNALRPGAVAERKDADPLQFVFDAARDNARLAMPSIRAVVSAHKGTLTTDPRDILDVDFSRPVTSFKIMLPSPMGDDSNGK